VDTEAVEEDTVPVVVEDNEGVVEGTALAGEVVHIEDPEEVGVHIEDPEEVGVHKVPGEVEGHSVPEEGVHNVRVLVVEQVGMVQASVALEVHISVLVVQTSVQAVFQTTDWGSRDTG